jgi:hypothetical protein
MEDEKVIRSALSSRCPASPFWLHALSFMPQLYYHMYEQQYTSSAQLVADYPLNTAIQRDIFLKE